MGKNNTAFATSHGVKKKEPIESEWHVAEVPEMNQSFGVQRERNERLQGTIRRCLSSDARGLGSTRLDHWAEHCLLLCRLLLYYPFTAPFPGPSFAEIKDSGALRHWTGTYIVHNVSVSLITESSWEDSGFCLCVQSCHKLFSKDFLQYVASRREGKFFIRELALCGIIL